MPNYLFPPIYPFILGESSAEDFSPEHYLWLGISHGIVLRQWRRAEKQADFCAAERVKILSSTALIIHLSRFSLLLSA